MKFIFLTLIMAIALHAELLISPVDSMKFTFSGATTIEKRNLLLSNEQVNLIEQEIKQKLKTKIYQIYKASIGDKFLGYGVLVSQNVRSKNCVVMYHISDKAILKSIEIIAFNEPREYLPSKKWTEVFNQTLTSQPLYLTKDIPAITGATLTARAVTDASRVAFAIYNYVLKREE